MKYMNLLTFAEQQSNAGKRVLYVILILVILGLAILSLIGWALVKFTKYRGKQIENEISMATKTGVILEAREFKKYYPRKNALLFYKEALPAIGFIAGGTLVYIIYMAVTKNWSYNPWSIEEGFGSLLLILDFTKIFQVNVNGTTGLLINWPTVAHSPTFMIENWCGYVSCLAWIIGGLWYIYATIGLIGRHFHAKSLEQSIYGVGKFNIFDSFFGNPNSNQNNNNNNQNPPQN